jgi:hypothetical protein
MYELVQQLERYVAGKGSIPLARATAKNIADTEASFGFPLPELLKSIYLNIGDGGFGPDKFGEMISLCHADDPQRTLLATYEGMKAGAEYFERKWPEGLLPFCFWGCTIYSCVDCRDARLGVYRCEDCNPIRQAFDLQGFVQSWLEGADLLDTPGSTVENVTVINPFTKKPMELKRRRHKHK